MKIPFHTWLKSIDFFGKNITLNMNGDPVYRTYIGGVTTLGTAFILFIVCLSSLQTFFNRELITAKLSRMFHDDPPYITLNKQNFMFAVNIQQDDFVTRPYFDIVITKRNDTRDSTGKATRNANNFPLERCTQEHWADLPETYDWHAKFIAMNFTNWLCPKKDFEMVLGGVYSSSLFSYYKINVQKCVDDLTIDKICKTDEEVAAQLSYLQGSFRFQLYQSNNIINQDQMQPKTSYLSDVTQFLFSPGELFITSNLFYSSYTMDVDTNIFVGKTIETEIVPYFSQSETYTQYLPQIGTSYSSFYMRKSLFQDTVTRSYQKVDGLISYIGGFAQSVVFAISFLVGFFTECSFNVELANKLYDFEAEDSASNSKNNGSGQNPGQKLQQLKKDQRSSGPNSPDQASPTGRIDANFRSSSVEKMTGVEVRNLIKERARTDRKKKGVMITKNDSKLAEFQRSTSEIALKNEQNVSPATTNILNARQKQQDINLIIDQKPNGNGYSLEEIIEVEQGTEDQKHSDFKFTNKLDKEHEGESVPPIFKRNANSLKKEFESESKFPEVPTMHETKINSLNEIALLKTFSNGNTKGIAASKPPVISTLNKFETKPSVSQTKVDLEKVEGLNFKSRRSFLINQFKDLVEKQAKITLKVGYFLNKLFCGKYFNSHQNKLVDRASKEISKDLDVFNLIERIKEVDKFKATLFDKEQQILFNFCPKPILNLRENNSNLTRAQILERLSSISARNEQKQKMKIIKPPRGGNMFIGGGKLLQNTIKAVQQFKKNIKQNGNLEIDSYKYLYEAYDSIMVSDPKLKKRKNKNLINQLGREMKDIFETSSLINFDKDLQSKPSFHFGHHSHTLRQINEEGTTSSQKNVLNSNGGASDGLGSNSDLHQTHHHSHKMRSKKFTRVQTFSDVDLKECFAEVFKQEHVEPIIEETQPPIETGGTGGTFTIPEEKIGNICELIHFSFDSMQDDPDQEAHRGTVRKGLPTEIQPPNTLRAAGAATPNQSQLHNNTRIEQQHQTEESFNPSAMKSAAAVDNRITSVEGRNLSSQASGQEINFSERHDALNAFMSPKANRELVAAADQSAPLSSKNQSSQRSLFPTISSSRSDHYNIPNKDL